MSRPWSHFLPPDSVRPFRGRIVDPDRPVEVHRNIARGGYSVRQDGLVVAHVDAVMLADAKCIVSRAGWERARRTGQRTVHAWVRGRLTDSGMGTTAIDADLRRIRYDLRLGMFIHDLTTLPSRQREFRGAAILALNGRGMFAAYFT